MPAAHYDIIDEFNDVESLGAYRKYRATLSEEETLEKINFGSRDNPRHPMAWDGTEGNGFTTGRPWLLPHSRAAEINVENDLAAGKSVYRFYQQLLKLRTENDAFTTGDLEVISAPEDDFFVFTRTSGDDKWAVVCNFEGKHDIELPFDCESPVLANLERTAASGCYLPYECAVARAR